MYTYNMKMNEQNFLNFLKKVKEYETEYLNEDSNDEECIHTITSTMNGTYVCEKCGCILGSVLESDFAPKTNIHGKRLYERNKYFRDLLNRVSGIDFNEKKAVDINEMPHSISGIRKYIYRNKLHPRNDYHYWRIKNGITQQIKREHMIDWEKDFKRTRKIKQKDFLYNRLMEIEEYHIFVPLFVRKKQYET